MALLPSFLHRAALLPGLSSPCTAAAGSSVLPSFTKLASGLLSVFLGSLNPLLCRPGSAANASLYGFLKHLSSSPMQNADNLEIVIKVLLLSKQNYATG